MSIYRISRSCGVSPATVSRVINNRPDVSEKTRAQVLKAMADEGFTPHTTKTTNNSICLFVDNADRDQTDVISDYIAKVVNGITYELFGNGYMLSVLPSWHAPQTKGEFWTFCRNHRIAGCIFANTVSQEHLDSLIGKNMPAVLLAQKPLNGVIKTVSSKSSQGGYDATKYLISMGHRRIVIFTAQGLWDYEERTHGYRKALAEHGLPIDESLIFRDWYNAKDYSRFLPALIDNPEGRPSAFIVGNDFEYLRLHTFLGALGYRIPRDFSVVGFDDYDYSAYCSPALTTVWQPIFDLGAHAARIILRMLDGVDAASIADVVLETRLIIRDSVARHSC